MVYIPLMFEMTSITWICVATINMEIPPPRKKRCTDKLFDQVEICMECKTSVAAQKHRDSISGRSGVLQCDRCGKHQHVLCCGEGVITFDQLKDAAGMFQCTI